MHRLSSAYVVSAFRRCDAKLENDNIREAKTLQEVPQPAARALALHLAVGEMQHCRSLMMIFNALPFSPGSQNRHESQDAIERFGVFNTARLLIMGILEKGASTIRDHYLRSESS